MHEPVDDVEPGEGLLQGVAVERVGVGDLDVAHARQIGVVVADDGPGGRAGVAQRGHQPAADVAGRPDHADPQARQLDGAHGRCSGVVPSSRSSRRR